MSKKNLFKIFFLLSLIPLMIFLINSFSLYADEIDIPEDEPIDEEYVIVDDYYSYTNTHYINSNSYEQNHYDEIYLLYTDYDDFAYETQNYLSITVNITLSVTRNTDNDASNGYIAVKNWHTNSNLYAEKEFSLPYGTYNKNFTFVCDLAHMSNSLCLCYKAEDNWWWTNDTWIYNGITISIHYNTYAFNTYGRFI